jgi:hypothetical protein
MMALLDVAVLVALPGIDRLRLHPILLHQSVVTTREELAARRLHRQTHPIGPMLGRHAPQGPHRVLKAVAEALKTLRETQRHVFPVRVRQHKVIDQVRERLAGNRHAQVGQVREVRRAQSAGQMLLREEHLLIRPARGPPMFDPPLQGPQLSFGEPPRIAALQFFEQGLGFPPRPLFEQNLDLIPDRGERIVARSPGALHHPLRAEPIRVPIRPCRFAIHACLRRCQSQRRLLAQPGPQGPNLRIRHHSGLPSMRGIPTA